MPSETALSAWAQPLTTGRHGAAVPRSPLCTWDPRHFHASWQSLIFSTIIKTLTPLFAHRSHRKVAGESGPRALVGPFAPRPPAASGTMRYHHAPQGGAAAVPAWAAGLCAKRMGFSPVPTCSSLTQKFSISCQCHTQWKILRKNERSRWDLSDGRFNLETEELTPLFQKNT